MALLIRDDEVAELLAMDEASDTVAEAFRQLGRGQAFSNPRSRIKLGGEILHVLPAALPEMDALGLKSYTAFREGLRFLVLLYSAKTGELKALIQAQRLGELRTGGVASVAIDKMAHADATEGMLFGAGTMGGAMLEGMLNARKLDRVTVVDTNPDRLHEFCDVMSSKLNANVVPTSNTAAELENAQVVVTMTTSKEPVFEGRNLSPGATVVAAGSNLLQKREIDNMTIRRADRIVVETIDQAQLEAGDLFQPIDAGHLHWNQVHELSSVLLDQVPARESTDEINIFKSVGVGIQDMAVAAHIYDNALQAGAGTQIPI